MTLETLRASDSICWVVAQRQVHQKTLVGCGVFPVTVPAHDGTISVGLMFHMRKSHIPGLLWILALFRERTVPLLCSARLFLFLAAFSPGTIMCVIYCFCQDKCENNILFYLCKRFPLPLLMFDLVNQQASCVFFFFFLFNPKYLRK